MALRAVSRWIESNEAFALQFLCVDLVEFYNRDATSLGRKYLVVGIDVLDEAVVGDGPEGPVDAVGEIVNGCFAPQPRKPGAPSIVLKKLRPTHVDFL